MKNFCLFFLTLILFTTCKKDDGPASTKQSDWLVPQEQILSGGPGKDGIPSIDKPKFEKATSIDYMSDDDLILGIKVGNMIKGYTHAVLDWHEIVNDEVNNLAVSLTYCPLTGTGIGWNRQLGNNKTSFGVSGLLFNSNLMPYDRDSDSYWSQMRLDCIGGDRIGQKIETIPFIETSWQTWKTLFPNSDVITLNTGYNRNYNRYPYGNYKQDNGLIFPADGLAGDFHLKERVLGVISNNKAKVYAFKYFAGEAYSVLQDEFGGTKLVIVGSEEKNVLVAYYRSTNGEERNFLQAGSDNQNIIMEDSKGNAYNLFGEVIAGPDIGDRLEQFKSMIGYWFVWNAFYPETEVYLR